ncbi:hypothetical protein HRbin30_02432 [bacterium HR30]|nr:hypothetical protein HRbin30_02432 [bacterium HR30]
MVTSPVRTRTRERCISGAGRWSGTVASRPGRASSRPVSGGQAAGGYGDGVGTGATQGTWIIEDSAFLHNTSDGLDLLYARPGASIVIRRTIAEGNAGNQIKTNGPTTIENTIVVGNCAYFNGQPFTYNVDNCRALGNALSLGLWRGTQVTVVNSTLTSQGDCLVLAGCDGTANSSESVVLRNNIFQGQTDFLQPFENTCLTYADACPADPFDTDYSVIVGVKGNSCPGANDMCGVPAGLVDSSIGSFDAHLMPGSPAIDSGLPVGGIIPGEDFDGFARPFGAGVDRGAYERDASSPAPTRTPTKTSTPTATATPTPSAAPTVGRDERVCRKEVRKNLLRFFKAKLTALQRCINAVNRGEATPPCPDAKASAEVSEAMSRVNPARLARKCPTAVLGRLPLGASCAGAADATSLATCIVTEAGAAVDALLPVEYSAANVAPSTTEERTCQATVAKAAGRRYAVGRIRTYDNCLNKRDRGAVPWCLDTASQDQLDRVAGQASNLVLARCTDSTIAALQAAGGFAGSCSGASTTTQLIACQTAEHDAQTNRVVNVLP